MPTHFRQALLALCILSVMQASFANETEHLQELESIDIQVTKEKTEKEVVDAQQIKKEMISNAHDLVRYNTEVDVAEVGRYGNKGFAIRGVDGNRVAMNIDGVALPDVEVNEVFSPYGYSYEGRLNPDVELMGGVRVTAGADSLISGSGAVGGAVSYSTKKPTDLLNDGNFGGYAKLGYSNKNEETLSAVGLAGKVGQTELILNYAHREGHELKNHDMRKHDKTRLTTSYDFIANGELGRASQPSSAFFPDSSKYKRDSILGKFYYHLNDEHRLGLQGLYQKQKTHTYAYSKSVTSPPRMAYDTEELKSYGLNYRYAPLESSWLNEFNAEYQHLDVKGIADTHVLSYTNKDYVSRQEYRPTETKINQTNLQLKFLPVNLNSFGSHDFILSGSYIKQNYTNTAKYLYPNNPADNTTPYAFADAKKDIYNISLMDNIVFTDRLKAMLGVRYDSYKYTPYFRDTEEHQLNTNVCSNPYYDYATRTVGWLNNSSFCNTYREQAGLTTTDATAFDHWRTGDATRKAWRDANVGKYTGLEKSKFDHVTWSGLIDYQIIADKLTARYKVGTGFLAPTVAQIYSNYSFNGVSQVPNFNLRPEKSLNQEIEFDWNVTDNVNVTVAGYITKYKDFIHTRYWQGRRDDPTSKAQGCTNGICVQSMNLDTAEIKGFKLGVNADVSSFFNLNGKLNLSANYHTSKDSAEVETDKNGKATINTLASVPTNFILGADYTSPDEDWSLHGRLRVAKAKKAKETKLLDIGETATTTTQKTPIPRAQGSEYYCKWILDPNNEYDSTTGTCYSVTGGTTYDYYEYVTTYDQIHRSKTSAVLDIYGSKTFGKNKNWVFNAGVYNITDQKYIPWETLRQFASSSVNNMVDPAGHGFNRYTAPGRNYAISLEYKF